MLHKKIPPVFHTVYCKSAVWLEFCAHLLEPNFFVPYPLTKSYRSPFPIKNERYQTSKWISIPAFVNWKHFSMLNLQWRFSCRNIPEMTSNHRGMKSHKRNWKIRHKINTDHTYFYKWMMLKTIYVLNNLNCLLVIWFCSTRVKKQNFSILQLATYLHLTHSPVPKSVVNTMVVTFPRQGRCSLAGSIAY